MTSEQYLILGKRTALISFLFGTFIFLMYYGTSSFELLFIGYGFIAIMGIINVFILFSILMKAKRTNDKGKKLYMVCGLMLLNIPVMLFYCWVAIILLNTMRITFTNTTNEPITDINIIGCEPKHINKLEPKESETVWVGITGDCTINIEYLSNGQKKEENVAEYVTNDMGTKVKYNIGGINEEKF